MKKSDIKTNIVKIFNPTKIDTVDERNKIKMATSFCYLCAYFSSAEVNDKEVFAGDIINTFHRLFSLQSLDSKCDSVVDEWYEDAFSTSAKIQVYFDLFIRTKSRICYELAINEMNLYCEINKANYAEWREELLKYRKGEIKAVLIALWIALWLGISTLYIENANNVPENVGKIDEFVPNMNEELSLSREI